MFYHNNSQYTLSWLLQVFETAQTKVTYAQLIPYKTCESISIRHCAFYLCSLSVKPRASVQVPWYLETV